MFVKVVYLDQPTICDLCKKTEHIRANCKGGRSISKGPAKRSRSHSKRGTMPLVKTQNVWVEKSKVVSEPKANKPSLCPATDLCNRAGCYAGHINVLANTEEDGTEKSDQDVDPLEWKEIQPKKKKKSKKKKKPASPQPPSTQKMFPKGKEIVTEKLELK